MGLIKSRSKWQILSIIEFNELLTNFWFNVFLNIHLQILRFMRSNNKPQIFAQQYLPVEKYFYIFFRVFTFRRNAFNLLDCVFKIFSSSLVDLFGSLSQPKSFFNG